jgi:hypothetical protein
MTNIQTTCGIEHRSVKIVTLLQLGGKKGYDAEDWRRARVKQKKNRSDRKEGNKEDLCYLPVGSLRRRKHGFS